MIDIILITLLTIGLYRLVKALERSFPILLFQPLILTPILIILTLSLLDISVEQYEQGAKLLTHMLGPATIAFAIPVYKHFDTVKKYLGLILVSTFIGSFVAIFSTFLLGVIFRLEDHLVVSLLPRSITTPLAIEVSTEIGAVPALTVIFVIITGVLGGLFAPKIFRLLQIETSMARGLALGMAAHAVGTNRALTYGEEAATYSTLAMIFAGIITTSLGLTLLPWLYSLIS
ncbi:LrgB family protein [Amphibacillus sp. Q70]|uniref:LrgB family protein n=1 Tax=Amphibacillus sp. Q70 TaxID=3453416 RepID=UPI003F8700C6